MHDMMQMVNAYSVHQVCMVSLVLDKIHQFPASLPSMVKRRGTHM